MTFFRAYQDRLGPGLMFAAIAVGVSHLIQSTRAGAEYGFSLIFVVIVACVLKYPAFRFSSDYAAATSEPMLEGYRKQGRWTVAIYALGMPIDMFISVAGISLVTSGIFRNVFAVNLGDVSIAISLMIACATLLISGRYRLFENITKFIVVLFSIFTVLAVGLAIPEVNWTQDQLTRHVEFDRSTLLFMIAIAGWMPTSVAASMFQSFWVCEKARLNEQGFSPRVARKDFDIGYWGTLLLALCFVFMGTALMYKLGISTASSPTAFAAQLIDMFTRVIGEWSRLIIAIAALAVMFSTMLSGMDASPRVASHLLGYFIQSDKQYSHKSYTFFMIVEVIGASLILVWLFSSFKTFIDFATSMAFIMSPLVAWFNHRAVFSDDMPESERPGPVMYAWSLAGIFAMLAIGLYFLFTKIS